ncbi:hypothetical protein F4778DRAFT_719644 [Xylariomycetidae sp. FL2044]|nr:hypothetical protein F4778DRAFT_719644 [Xylariomycetidae sp. FL2044]
MATNYSGRRGQAANVSQLLQDLNRIPEPAAAPSEENLSGLDDELARFTNTTFIDWDSGNTTAPTPQLSMDIDSSNSPTTSPTAAMGDLNFDFNLPADFNGFDFTYPTPNASAYPPESIGNHLQPLQPSPTYPTNASQQNAYGTPISQAGEKRKSDASIPAPPPRRQLSMEEQSRLAAEEDKRRRNTAASARFRVKKKAREQALEKREKELADKVGSLEGRIQLLETENKWLRNLVMEKSGTGDSMISPLLEKQSATKSGASSSESSGSDHEASEKEKAEKSK